MKINFNQVMKDLDGKTIKANGDPQTLRRVCVNSLLSLTDGEMKMSGEERFKLADLARNIHGAESLELKAEDIALLKKRIGQLYLPLTVLIAYEMLEKKNEEPTHIPQIIAEAKEDRSQEEKKV